MAASTDSSNEIFVFGSNLAGRHGKGAARDALRKYGAIYGQSEGLQGQSYAIPTKDAHLSTLHLKTIHLHVCKFKQFASDHPELTFRVTRVGCGLAGIPEEIMKVMFRGCPKNCIMPEGW